MLDLIPRSPLNRADFDALKARRGWWVVEEAQHHLLTA
jgi:hypothetical protein